VDSSKGSFKSSRPARCAQVLRKTGTAESEAGFQVRRRHIQFPVFAQRVHHFTGVDAELLADGADFIRERYFHGVKCVAGVLDHLGRAQ